MGKKSGLHYTEATGRIPMDAADISSRSCPLFACCYVPIRPSLSYIHQPNAFCRRQVLCDYHYQLSCECGGCI